MSHSTSLRPRKSARIHRSKSKEYLLDLKHYGPEPTLDGTATQIDFIKAFSWYAYMCDAKEARQFLIDGISSKETREKIARLPDDKLPMTAAWISRMQARGTPISKHFAATYVAGVEKAIASLSSVPCEQNSVPTAAPTVRDRMREKLSDAIAEIEGMLDDETYDVSPYEWFQKQDLAKAYVPAIIHKYQPLLIETVAATKGTDDQVKEAYRFSSSRNNLKRAEFLIRLIQDAKKYAESKKAARKPRAPRPVSVEKKLQHFRYCKESTELKAASVLPEKVLGASELWTFDRKYKVLTRFVGLDRGGLSINRSSITSYDPAKSVSKRTGRKGAEILHRVIKAGKRAREQILSELADCKLQERCNENILLIKVDT